MREKNKERHRGEKERESERRKKQRFLTNLVADQRARHATTPGYTDHHIQFMACMPLGRLAWRNKKRNTGAG